MYPLSIDSRILCFRKKTTCHLFYFLFFSHPHCWLLRISIYWIGNYFNFPVFDFRNEFNDKLINNDNNLKNIVSNFDGILRCGFVTFCNKKSILCDITAIEKKREREASRSREYWWHTWHYGRKIGFKSWWNLPGVSILARSESFVIRETPNIFGY